MTRVTIELPEDVGASRITVFGPDGAALVGPRLLLPSSAAFEFEAAKAGIHTASLDTLDDDRRFWSFAVEPAGTLRVQAPTIDAAKLDSRNARSGLALGSVGDNLHRYAAYSLGLSRDAGFTSWQPAVADGAVKTHHTKAGDIEVEFQPPGLRDDAAIRLRLSFAVEGSGEQQLVVPLFADGVVVRVRTATSPRIMDNKLSVVPKRREIHALLQALASSSMDVAGQIWDDLKPDQHQAMYADDPWALVAVLLLMFRLGRLNQDDSWLQLLARFPWLADASVLAAHKSLSQDEPDIDGALNYLERARNAGPVYFSEANRLQRDILISLAADAPHENQRRLAANELRLWRRSFANQIQSGAFFCWQTADGHGAGGVLNQSDKAILDRGVLNLSGIGADVSQDSARREVRPVDPSTSQQSPVLIASPQKRRHRVTASLVEDIAVVGIAAICIVVIGIAVVMAAAASKGMLLNSQLIAGCVVGLVVWSLMSDRPLLRDLLVAVASAFLLDVLSGRRSPPDVGSMIERLSTEISIHPHFLVGLVLAAAGATVVSRLKQQVQIDE